MQPSQLDEFIIAFSSYIENGDVQSLTPFITENANPAFLKIYRNGVLKACFDALSTNFPTLKLYLGDELFKNLSRKYIRQHWPKDTRLSKYGDRFADFISDESKPFCRDFAKLDRAWLDALFASDEPSLTKADIANILTPENQEKLFSLQLANSVKLVYLDCDSINHWIKLKFSDDADNQADANTILFWRYQQQVQYRVLSEFEENFIQSMNESKSILTSAETAVSKNPDQDLGALFGALLTAGVLVNQSKLKAGK